MTDYHHWVWGGKNHKCSECGVSYPDSCPAASLTDLLDEVEVRSALANSLVWFGGTSGGINLVLTAEKLTKALIERARTPEGIPK